MLVNFYHTTWPNIPEDSHLQMTVIFPEKDQIDMTIKDLRKLTFMKSCSGHRN
jgi:hypothetical protein